MTLTSFTRAQVARATAAWQPRRLTSTVSKG